MSVSRKAGIVDKIRNWVVVMFENRSFDSMLGHLPHIPAEDGIRDREIVLDYPKGTVTIHPSTNFTDPIPDPGEEYPAVMAQVYGRYIPESNAGKSPYRIFPDYMQAPYNAARPGDEPTMDGFALDYYYSGMWERGAELNDAEMQSFGGVFTPESAPVINGLAREYAVFTHWHCDAPTCTFPNRSFFHAGTSGGLLDNEITYNYAWTFDHENLFQRATERDVSWTAYFDPSQKVCLTAINLAGLKHRKMWKEHTKPLDDFYADAAAGTLPQYSWVEPNMLFGDLCDYHPPRDIRAGEQFLAQVYEAVRNSPQWEQTALVVMFDEHGGCYDHVAPPQTVSPDGKVSPEGFEFDMLGIRIPTIIISAWTARETVIRDLHTNTSMTRTLRESLNLGDAFTKRDAWARPVTAAFNLDQPRTDTPDIRALTFTPGVANPHAQQPVPGDIPSDPMWAQHEKKHFAQAVSHLGQATLRNAAHLLGKDPDAVPGQTADQARDWLGEHFYEDGQLSLPQAP